MLCGSVFAMYCVEKYKNVKKGDGYASEEDQIREQNARILVVVSVIVFLVELCLLVYALNTALNWPVSSGLERFVHVFFAVFMTIPYILVTIIAKFTMRSNVYYLLESQTHHPHSKVKSRSRSRSSQ